MGGLAWAAFAAVALGRLLGRRREGGLSARVVTRIAATALPLGLLLRLYGFERSLWIDEIATRWTVARDLASVLERTQAFHGQSAFYYLLLWPWRQAAGESAIALRLPSLLTGAAAAALIGDTGRRLGGRAAGWAAASLAWLSFPFIEAAAQARVYSLALALAALAVWGFARAVLQGSTWGRAAFVAGAAGLFAAHYPLAVIFGGVALAWTAQPALRERYPPTAFLLDAAIVAAVSLVWTPHLAAVWARRDAVAWNPEVDFWAALEGAGPLLVLAAVGVAAQRSPARAVERSLWAAALAPAVALGLLAWAGPNLLERRYAVAAAVPAAVLAGLAVGRAPWPRLLPGAVFWLGTTMLYLAAAFSVSGSFTLAGRQDWAAARARLEQGLAAHPGAVVLLRSGFVEEDRRASGPPPRLLDGVFRAPLRAPGEPQPDWNVAPLTYRWSAPGRGAYFEREIVPRIRGRDTLYFVSCQCLTPSTGEYPERLTRWIETRFPGEFRVSESNGPRGILWRKLERRTSPSPAPASR